MLEYPKLLLSKAFYYKTNIKNINIKLKICIKYTILFYKNLLSKT